MKRASDLWKETNSQALDRLNRLKGIRSVVFIYLNIEMPILPCFSDNQAAWERYEQKRDELTKKLDGADAELENINQVSLFFLQNKLDGTLMLNWKKVN